MAAPTFEERVVETWRAASKLGLGLYLYPLGHEGHVEALVCDAESLTAGEWLAIPDGLPLPAEEGAAWAARRADDLDQGC